MKKPKKASKIRKYQQKVWLFLQNKYESILRKIIFKKRRRRFLIIGVWVLFFALLTMPALGLLKTTMFPKIDIDFFTVRISMPVGTILEDTEKVTTEVEQLIHDIPEVDNYVSNIGTSQGLALSGGFGGSERANSHLSTITVNLMPKDERKKVDLRESSQVIEDLHEKRVPFEFLEAAGLGLSVLSHYASNKDLRFEPLDTKLLEQSDDLSVIDEKYAEEQYSYDETAGKHTDEFGFAIADESPEKKKKKLVTEVIFLFFLVILLVGVVIAYPRINNFLYPENIAAQDSFEQKLTVDVEIPVAISEKAYADNVVTGRIIHESVSIPFAYKELIRHSMKSAKMKTIAGEELYDLPLNDSELQDNLVFPIDLQWLAYEKEQLIRIAIDKLQNANKKNTKFLIDKHTIKQVSTSKDLDNIYLLQIKFDLSSDQEIKIDEKLLDKNTVNEPVQTETATEAAVTTDFATEDVEIGTASKPVESIKPLIVIQDTELGWLNVRDLPDSGSSILGEVYPMEKYEIFETEEKWFKIEFEENQYGWVFAEYVDLIEE